MKQLFLRWTMELFFDMGAEVVNVVAIGQVVMDVFCLVPVLVETYALRLFGRKRSLFCTSNQAAKMQEN